MNVAVIVILVVAVALIVLVVVPRVRRVSTSEKTTVDRRSGIERRRRPLEVPLNRRKRARRADDIAEQFVSGLESKS